MTPTLVKFTNINNELFYVNTNRIEYVMFIPLSNAFEERVYIRCGEGLVDTTIRQQTAALLKEKLNYFVP